MNRFKRLILSALAAAATGAFGATAPEAATLGEALGQKIIDWREANGDFTSIDEIVDEIDGIGENSIENMRMFITLEDDVS